MAVFVFDVMNNVVLPMVLGGVGGLLTAIYKFKGDLEMPTVRRLKTKTILRLGFFKDIFLGAGAGAIAANVFFAINAMPELLVGCIIAAFAGMTGARYLFKRNNDTRTLDDEVNEIINFLTRRGEDEDDE